MRLKFYEWILRLQATGERDKHKSGFVILVEEVLFPLAKVNVCCSCLCIHYESPIKDAHVTVNYDIDLFHYCVYLKLFTP